MKITALIDNRSSDETRFASEHGLSLRVEKGGKSVLFDAGASDLAAKNAMALGVELVKTDIAVCSHGHYDHGVGFAELILSGSIGTLVTGEGFFEPKFTREDNGMLAYAGTGLSEELLSACGVRHMICKEKLELANGVWAIGTFSRGNALEPLAKKFLLRENGAWRVDRFDDEIALVVENDLDDGVTAIVGCSHPGILNMLTTIRQRLGRRITAVIGGTHLMEANEARVMETLRQMRELGVERLGLSHCSGMSAIEYIRNAPSADGFYVAAGDSITL